MTEVFRPTFDNPPEDKTSYWEQVLEDAERSVAYAKKMLAQLAIENSGANTL